MSPNNTSSAKLKITIRTDREIIGGEIFNISVDITNLGRSAITDVYVTPQIIAGTLIPIREGPENIELETLEAKRHQLIRELETQISLAYEQKEFRNLSRNRQSFAKFLRLAKSLSELVVISPLGAVLGLFANKMISDDFGLSVPIWAREALKIETWDDLERLEQAIISGKEEDSFLRIAYLLNKAKLRRLLDDLDTKKSAGDTSKNKLKDSYSVQTTDTISFPFKVRAQQEFGIRDYSIQFLISYKDPERGTTGTFSANQEIRIFPSPSIISMGVVAGALGGFLVKVGMVNQIAWFTSSFWINLIGTVVLAFAMAFITVSSPNSEKPIKAENFVGGFIIGVLTGMFSETIIERLQTILKSM